MVSLYHTEGCHTVKEYNVHLLIRAAGNARNLASLLKMERNRGGARIAQWKKRGIPKSLVVAYATTLDRIMRRLKV